MILVLAKLGRLTRWPLDLPRPGEPERHGAGFVAALRMWAAILSAVLTTLVTLALCVSQPASLATTLLVSLGSMQTARDAVAIMISVLILAAIGEPLQLPRAKAGRRAYMRRM